jgi:hypothetical protein
LGDDQHHDIENANPESVELRLKDNKSSNDEANKKSINNLNEEVKEDGIKINDQDRI